VNPFDFLPAAVVLSAGVCVLVFAGLLSANVPSSGRSDGDTLMLGSPRERLRSMPAWADDADLLRYTANVRAESRPDLPELVEREPFRRLHPDSLRSVSGGRWSGVGSAGFAER
jgi:hypothetical protein